MKHSQSSGFTLAELLIALALLGIIAAFTIPKVLQSASTQETNSKLRETVSTLENSWNNLVDTNTILWDQMLYDNIAPQMNTVASGPGAVDAGGAPFQGLAPVHPCAEDFATQNGWVQFSNGVVVSGLWWRILDTYPGAFPPGDVLNYVICIDVNGRSSPNLPGQDVFIGNFNHDGYRTGVGAPPFGSAAARRVFYWGNAGSGTDSDIYDWLGGVYATGSYPQFGDGNTAMHPSATVGSRLAQ